MSKAKFFLNWSFVLPDFMQCLYQELRKDRLETHIVTTTIHPFFMGTFDLIVDAHRISG